MNLSCNRKFMLKILSTFRFDAKLSLGYIAALGAALAGFSPSVLAQEQELGRLFFSPQQRQDLDRRRASNAQAAATTVTTEDLVTINGKVSRSSGKTTTWINGVPQEDTHRGPDASRVTIQQTEDAPEVSLKVGETLDRVKNETRNGLNAGSISIKRDAKK
jgi:hypothetical protein